MTREKDSMSKGLHVKNVYKSKGPQPIKTLHLKSWNQSQNQFKIQIPKVTGDDLLLIVNKHDLS